MNPVQAHLSIDITPQSPLKEPSLLEREQKAILNTIQTLSSTCQGYYEHRESDRTIIDAKISELFHHTINISDLIKQQYHLYYTQLINLAGMASTGPITWADKNSLTLYTTAGQLNKDACILEDWQAHNFLPLRITFLFWITLSLQNGAIPDRALPPSCRDMFKKMELIKILTKEIAIELRSWKITQVFQDKKSRYCDTVTSTPQSHYRQLSSHTSVYLSQNRPIVQLNQSLSTMDSAQEKLLNDHVDSIMEQISKLENGEELCYPTGPTDYTVYVNFCRINTYISIRIDTVGALSNNPEYHVFDPTTNSIKPCLLALLDLNDDTTCSMLKSYVRHIASAPSCDLDIAKKLIYDRTTFQRISHLNINTYTTISEKWPNERTQTIANSVVASHNVGFRIRLYNAFDQLGINEIEKQHLHKWVIEQEIRTCSTPYPQIGIM